MAGTHIGGKNDRAFFGAQVGVSGVGVGSLRLTYYWGRRREESGAAAVTQKRERMTWKLLHSWKRDDAVEAAAQQHEQDMED